MDKKKSFLNVAISLLFKLILLFTSIYSRRIVIQYIGNEANGINSLFLSIIGVLSIAELGVGSAIAFGMYEPIVEGDSKKVSALYFLYKKLYLIIGAIILITGILIIPFLPSLTKQYEAVNINLGRTFFLMLISTVLTYLFGAEISLINAYKNNYITSAISSIGLLLQQGMQIVVVMFTQSFELYLVCRIVSAAVQWIVTELIVKKSYPDIIAQRVKLDRASQKNVNNNIKAMFMHKVGGVLVNTTDSIIISSFIGVIILGKYSNYTTIMTSMTELLKLFFTPLISIIGHMYFKEDKEVSRQYFSYFHIINFSLGVIFFLGYYAVIDPIITICFGTGLELPRSISFVITLNYFIQFMRQSPILFRNATGTFYNDRWKPVVEGTVNVVFSIVFVKLFPEDLRVVGVIVATILTNVLICHVVEPYVLYKYAFQCSTKKFYVENYAMIMTFTIALISLEQILIQDVNPWKEMLVNGVIAIGIALIILSAELMIKRDFCNYLRNLICNKEKNLEK